MRAVILAAGFGTRLWPLTEDRTKPAIPFLNRPLISYSVQYLAEQGIPRIIINVHHQPESIRDALGDGSKYGAEIEYSYEEEILGTSGALDRVREKLADGDFVVVNGKIVTSVNLSDVIRQHRASRALATLVLRPNAARARFSTVEVDADSRIKGFGPHPAPLPPGAASEAAAKEAAGPTTSVDPMTGQQGRNPAAARRDEATPLMFTGIQVLSPRIFEYIPRGVFSHSTVHVYPKAIQAGEPVIGYVSESDWYEMSTLDRYLDASLALIRKTGDGDERVVVGRGCVIQPGSQVRDSVLWDHVVVEAGASVEQSIIGDGVRILSESKISRAAVVRRDAVQKIERGTVAGENLLVPID